MNLTELSNPTPNNRDLTALILRIGLGLVFVIGGTSKLSQLLSANLSDKIVDNYMGTSGYINSLFQDWLFTGIPGSVLSAWGFLTALSAFELISGLMLIAGLLVRPLALVYSLLLWTFVIALPVMTVPGESLTVKTYTSPALLVQVRDVGLSGMMFVLFMLGAGRHSIDHYRVPFDSQMEWTTGGTILRLSLGLVLLVGGLFHGYAYIASFATPGILLTLLGLLLIVGPVSFCRVCGAITVVVMLWFMITKLNADKSLISNLNGFKREFAFAAAGIVMALYGGSERFIYSDLLNRGRRYFQGYFGAKSDDTSGPIA